MNYNNLRSKSQKVKYRPPFGEGFPFLENHAGLRPALACFACGEHHSRETAAFSPHAKRREGSAQNGMSAHAACIELVWQPCTRWAMAAHEKTGLLARRLLVAGGASHASRRPYASARCPNEPGGSRSRQCRASAPSARARLSLRRARCAARCAGPAHHATLSWRS